MRLDITKIEDRIRKLQELRRIACDPEMANIFSQCLTTDDTATPVNSPEPDPVVESRTSPPEIEASEQGRSDEAEAVIQSVMTGGGWHRRAR